MAANTKRDLVIDASFVLSFLMPDEYQEEVHHLFNQYQSGLINFVTSQLMYFEAVNGLRTALMRKRLTLEYAKERVEELLDYEIDLKEVDLKEALLLGEKHNLTVYDASYLYLAKSQNLPLLTLDEKLKKLS
ncbi:type II toxin-antitoxin system VapC family toxin [Candidatus Daviesbacteria bacterium]|nr:type II toxin-antitoxin system VapC family toxin [Candidatus Daviesbacteria bacterium]